MAAATRPDGAVTPELALIDPELGAELRAASGSPNTASQEGLGAAWPTESLDALQRLVGLCDVEPPRRLRRFDTAKLGLAVATWSAFAVLLMDTQLDAL